MARKGIDLGTKFHAYGLQIIDDLMLLKMFASIKGHMLAKMSQSILIRIFKNGTSIHNQIKFGSLFGLTILLNVVSQSIGKLPYFY